MAADDPNRHREPTLGDGVVPDFMTALAHANQRTAGPRVNKRQSSRSKVAGIHAAGATGTDCTRSPTKCSSISSPGAASPFSAAISGAISSTCETSCSKVAASVVSGNSSLEHHHHRGLAIPLRLDLKDLSRVRHPVVFRGDRSPSEMIADGSESTTG